MNISSSSPVLTRESLKEESFRPMRLLPLIAGFTVLALICLVWNAFTSIKQIEQLERQCLRLAELRGAIVHFDEVLTMSARMAAATGDTQWEARYREFEPKLAGAIQEALAVTPKFGANELVEGTMAANSALATMENSAFEFVRLGRLEAARATLDSEAYRRQKVIYTAGLKKLDSVLKLSIPHSVEQKIRGVTLVLIFAAVVLPLLVGCLIMTLRTSERWKAALVQQSANLAEISFGLDRMVSERTSELERSREIARQVLDTAYDPFIAIGIDGRITEWNVQAGAIFGWPREEVLGRRLSETIIPLRYREDHDRGMKHYHATGESPFLNRNIEFTALHRDGHEIPVEIIVWPVGVGRTTSFNAFVRDITKRKQADAALAERASITALSADVGIAIAQGDSLPTILQHCCEALVRHLNAALARVWTINKAGSVLDLQASAGMYTHINGEHAHLPVDKFKIGHIALEGKPHFTNHIVGDLRVGDREWAIQEGMVAFAGHPLIVQGETMGVMAIYARHPFAPATIDALAIVANSVALGIKRKSTEEDLRQAKAAADAANEARQEQFLELENLYRTAPVGLELLDRDFRVIRVNERLAAINGLSVDQNIGRTLRETIPQFASQIEVIVEQVFATGEPILNVEVHGITQADPTTERDWIVGYYPVKGQDGVPRYVGCVILEITELKKVEMDLRRHKDLLQTVIDHIPCAVFWKDRQCAHLGGNQLAASDLGFATPAEMIGKNNFDLAITREEAESFTRFDREVMENGKPLLHFEEVVTKPDGTRLDVLTSKVPLRDAAGEVFGVLAIYLDISDRKRAEQQLANHVKRLQEQAELLDLAHDAITVRDLDGAFSFWSKGAEEMYGWTSAEALGKVSHDLFKTRFPKALSEINADLLREGRWEGTVMHTCKDGSVIVAASRWAVKTNTQDNLINVLEINTDITAESKAQEAQVRAKEAAEAANLAKSEFLANMSHEIRTPMNGILGMTELALDSDLTAEQRENLGMVKASADSLLQVINDILDFSKIEARKLELDPIPFALRDSLDATVNALGQRAHEKRLALICRIDTDVPDSLVGDALRLRQVITNLIGNAIKFTERGEVVVEVEVEGQPAEKICLHFRVRDTGIGIPIEKQQAIFEAFAQADSSTTRSFGGTGLGLAITSQLVALMGGRIWVESELGAGSTFHFTVLLGAGNLTALQQLPIKAAVATAPPASEAGAQPARRLNILLADDNEINQRVAIGVLEKRGHVVQPVNNGKEVLQALACECFDLVLMDVQMPEMDGLEVTAAIRKKEQETGGHIPIVAMTARAMKGDRERCLAAGMDDYLAKPVEPNALHAVLDRWGAAGSCNDSQPPNQFSEDNDFLLANAREGTTEMQLLTQLPIPKDDFDIEALHARVENDLDLLVEMIDLYLSSSPLLLIELESAVVSRDGVRVNRVAHTLKGVLGNMCASNCAEVAAQLEILGTTGDFDRIDQSLATMKHEFERLQSVLTGVLQEVKA